MKSCLGWVDFLKLKIFKYPFCCQLFYRFIWVTKTILKLLSLKLHGASKGQKKLKLFFQVDVSSKKRMNEFYFTTMKPLVDLFSFVFWKKLMTPKRHSEINWPLVVHSAAESFSHANNWTVWKASIQNFPLLSKNFKA